MAYLEEHGWAVDYIEQIDSRIFNFDDDHCGNARLEERNVHEVAAR